MQIKTLLQTRLYSKCVQNIHEVFFHLHAFLLGVVLHFLAKLFVVDELDLVLLCATSLKQISAAEERQASRFPAIADVLDLMKPDVRNLLSQSLNRAKALLIGLNPLRFIFEAR